MNHGDMYSSGGRLVSIGLHRKHSEIKCMAAIPFFNWVDETDLFELCVVFEWCFCWAAASNSICTQAVVAASGHIDHSLILKNLAHT